MPLLCKWNLIFLSGPISNELKGSVSAKGGLGLTLPRLSWSALWPHRSQGVCKPPRAAAITKDLNTALFGL